MTLSKLTIPVLAVMAAVGLSGPVQSQDAYPQRVITLIAATAPGGPGDIAARLIAEHMSPILGQQIIVENVPGAGGILGAQRLARAEPDGYTLLVHQTGITILPAVTPNLSFNVEKDLTTVGLVNTSYSFLIGRKDLPPANYRELIAWMKAPGNSAKIAYPGPGSLGHLITLLFGKSAGAQINPIAYKGIGPAMNDILGRHVDLVWAGAVAAAPLINGGKVKGYAFGGNSRSKLAPEVPAMPELGAPELVIPFWHGMFAPAGTPKPIVDKLNAALRQALAKPEVVKAYERGGVEAFPSDMLSVEASNAFVRSELKKWSTAGQMVK